MDICPICLNAVPGNISQCPFCSVDLETTDDPMEIDERIEWVTVCTVSTEIEARLIAGRLWAHQLPAFVLSQVDTTRNFTVGALAVAKVFVPVDRLEEAERLLASRSGDPFDQEE